MLPLMSLSFENKTKLNYDIICDILSFIWACYSKKELLKIYDNVIKINSLKI